MPVRLCFENKKILSCSYSKEKNIAIGLNSDFFPPNFDGTLQIDIIFRGFKENLAKLPNPKVKRYQ